MEGFYEEKKKRKKGYGFFWDLSFGLSILVRNRKKGTKMKSFDWSFPFPPDLTKMVRFGKKGLCFLISLILTIQTSLSLFAKKKLQGIGEAMKSWPKKLWKRLENLLCCRSWLCNAQALLYDMHARENRVEELPPVLFWKLVESMSFLFLL